MTEPEFKKAALATVAGTYGQVGWWREVFIAGWTAMVENKKGRWSVVKVTAPTTSRSAKKRVVG